MSRKLEDWIDAYMTYTDNTEPCDLYRKWVAISTVAAALRRKCYLDWGFTGTIYPNMYVLLVGPSSARKTTAMRNGLEFISSARLRIASDAITREALIGELEAAMETSPLDGEGKMSMHSSLTILSPELTVFLGSGKSQNPQFLADLSDWFDCAELWRYKTKTSGVNEIVGVWVNLLGATTPHLIRGNLPLDTIGGGLASRIIFVYAEAKGKIVPFPFPTEEENRLGEKLHHDYELMTGLKGAFKFTRGFRDSYFDWYMQQESGTRFDANPSFDGYRGRRPLHLLKLCMVVSASMGNKMLLDEVVFNKAADLLAEVEVPMQETFAGFGQGKNTEITERVMKLFEKQRKVTRQELYTRFRYDIDNKEHLDEILALLIDFKFITPGKRGPNAAPLYYEYCFDQTGKGGKNVE